MTVSDDSVHEAFAALTSLCQQQPSSTPLSESRADRTGRAGPVFARATSALETLRQKQIEFRNAASATSTHSQTPAYSASRGKFTARVIAEAILANGPVMLELLPSLSSIEREALVGVHFREGPLQDVILAILQAVASESRAGPWGDRSLPGTGEELPSHSLTIALDILASVVRSRLHAGHLARHLATLLSAPGGLLDIYAPAATSLHHLALTPFVTLVVSLPDRVSNVVRGRAAIPSLLQHAEYCAHLTQSLLLPVFCSHVVGALQTNPFAHRQPSLRSRLDELSSLAAEPASRATLLALATDVYSRLGKLGHFRSLTSALVPFLLDTLFSLPCFPVHPSASLASLLKHSDVRAFFAFAQTLLRPNDDALLDPALQSLFTWSAQQLDESASLTATDGRSLFLQRSGRRPADALAFFAAGVLQPYLSPASHAAGHPPAQSFVASDRLVQHILVDKYFTGSKHLSVAALSLLVDAIGILDESLIALDSCDSLILRPVLLDLLKTWGSPSFVKRSAFDHHLQTTQTLLLLLGRLNAGAITAARSEILIALVQGVQSHLGSPLMRVRRLAMVMAECFTGTLSPETAVLKFDVEEDDETSLLRGLSRAFSERVHSVAAEIGQEQLPASLQGILDTLERVLTQGSPAHEGTLLHAILPASFGGRKPVATSSLSPADGDGEVDVSVARPGLLPAIGLSAAGKSRPSKPLISVIEDPADSLDRTSNARKAGRDDSNNNNNNNDDDDDDEFPSFAIPEEDQVSVRYISSTPLPLPPQPSLEQTGAARSRVVAPKYLRDCLKGLVAKNDADRAEAALQSCEHLLRSTPLEKDDISAEMAKALLYMQDEYSIPGFEACRLKSLIASVVRSPASVARFLSLQFYARNHTLRQRTDILDALCSAAMELSTGKSAVFSLAQSSGRLVQQSKEAVAKIQEQVSKSLGAGAGSRGTVTRVSTASLALRSQPPRAVWRNRLQGVAGWFFYPLMEKFDSAEGGELYGLLKDDAAFVLGRLCHCLGVVMQCASTCTDAPSMAKALLSFVWTLRQTEHVYVRRALLFCVSMVVVSVPASILVADMAADVLEAQAWLADVMQGDPDADCRELSLLALSHIVQVMKSGPGWEA